MNEIDKIKDLMLRMGEYLPKTQYLRESKEFLVEAHENIETLLSTRYKNIGKDTAMKLLLFDPTYQKGPLVNGEYPKPSKKAGNYGVWILDRYLNGEITLDDGDKVYKTLNVFKNIGSKLTNSNINAYSSFQELYDEALPFINGEKNMNTHSEMVDKYRHIPDTEIPYEDDFWLVVTPFNEEASCQVGGGTEWCTASRKSVNKFWYYAAHAPLFVIISKSENGVKYQYNKWSDEFNNVQNDYVDRNSVGLSPKLLEWLKDGTDEYKAKYLQEIKPYKKQYIQQIEQRLANGDNPKYIFNYFGWFQDEFAMVRLDGIGWNFVKTDGTLLWHGEKWFDFCSNFYNGFAIVKIENKGWNFLKTDGTLLWSDDKWFDWCYDFKDGFAKVQYNGEWCYLTQSGDLMNMEQYIPQIKQRLANGENPEDIFDEVGEFVNGFVKVRLEGMGWNFLKTDGTLLWPGDTWFKSCYDFQNGFASVLYKGEWCRITQNGDLISTKQYFQQIEQRLANGEDPKKIFNYVEVFVNGFAIVRLDRIGYNFLKTDGTLLWNREKWFSMCSNFKDGFASVLYNGNDYNIDTKGLLYKRDL